MPEDTLTEEIVPHMSAICNCDGPCMHGYGIQDEKYRMGGKPVGDDTLVLEPEEKVEYKPVGDLLRDMVSLERFGYTPMGTFGRMRYKGYECYTVERPWENNAPYVSCIPTGIYPLKLGKFYGGGYPCYELEQVPNRTLIKIHRGNTMLDVKGCIVLGTKLGVIEKLWAVLNSRKAHDEFLVAMRDNPASKLYINIHNLDVGTWSMPSYATVGG